MRQPAAKAQTQPQPRVYLAASAFRQIPQLLLQKLNHSARVQPRTARGIMELEQGRNTLQLIVLLLSDLHQQAD